MNIVKKLIVPAVLGLSMLPLSASMASTASSAPAVNQAAPMTQLAYYGCHRRCFTVRRCWGGYWHNYRCHFVPVCRTFCRHWYY